MLIERTLVVDVFANKQCGVTIHVAGPAIGEDATINLPLHVVERVIQGLREELALALELNEMEQEPPENKEH